MPNLPCGYGFAMPRKKLVCKTGNGAIQLFEAVRKPPRLLAAVNPPPLLLQRCQPLRRRWPVPREKKNTERIDRSGRPPREIMLTSCVELLKIYSIIDCGFCLITRYVTHYLSKCSKYSPRGAD
jgi:hypothetical protein